MGQILKPEILIQPLLPTPLKSLAPKTVLGTKWWDNTRKKMYAINDDCCWVCGTHKDDAWYRKWLEAHEILTVDFDNMRITLDGLAGLCHQCHSFIHVGRLVKQYHEGVVGKNYVRNVLDWGVQQLTKNDMKPTATQAYHWLLIQKDWDSDRALSYIANNNLADEKQFPTNWSAWTIIMGGEKYHIETTENWLKEF